MITIHQAIYGDKSGGYALLASSFTDDNIPKRIGNATDVLDRPVGEILKSPITRGFSIGDYYLIVKSFPHGGEKIRLGRVFSHALFIEKKDTEKTRNLKGILDLLMLEINFNPSIHPIQFDEQPMSQDNAISSKSRAAYGVKGLLNHGEFSSTLAWVGEDGYFDFLYGIWAGFPNHLRSEIAFGAAFDPRKVKGNSIKIFHIDPELASKWKKMNFLVIEESNVAELKKESEFYLLGDKVRASSLESMIQRFKLGYDQIFDLVVLEKVVAAFQELNSTIEFDQLIVFTDLISSFNPNPNSAPHEKDELLSKIASRIPTATIKEILGLRNVNWKGFANPEVVIGNALEDWGKRTVSEVPVREIPKVIVSAFGDSNNKESWWHAAIRKGVISELRNWRGNHAKVIWEWIQIEPPLVTFLADVAKQNIPKQEDLAEHLPALEKSTSLEILAVSKSMKWLQLHGKVLARIFPFEKAVNRQLEIDTDPDHFPALRLMAKETTGNDFINVSVSNGDLRLLEISSELVSMNPSLLENLDVQNSNWREIWLKAILKGAKPLNGIPDAQKSLFALLDLLIAGKEIDSKLIDPFSTTPFGDLSNFHARNDVWKALPVSSRDRYLSVTARAFIESFDRGVFLLASIEQPLLEKFANEAFFKSISIDKNIKVLSKIALFEYISTIGPSHLLMVLEDNNLDHIQATHVGNLILQRGWVHAARFLWHRVSSRRDFSAALCLCYSLLSFFETIMVRISGYAEVSISSEEWYQALGEICSELLAKGPSQNGIWEASGGKNGDLLISSSGKEAWIHALDQIKKGKSEVRIEKLLNELRKEFPKSEQLKTLEQVRPK